MAWKFTLVGIKSKMGNKNYLRYAIAFMMSVAVISMFFLNKPINALSMDQLNQKSYRRGIADSNRTPVYLYFADEENAYLIAEERSLSYTAEPAQFGKDIIGALITGPDKQLMRTIPINTTLRALYLTNKGTAFVDLSENVKENHPGGIKSELITIYSIVNSLILNIEQIKTVKILIGGRESITLAGHIDLRFPLKANMLLVR